MQSLRTRTIALGGRILAAVTLIGAAACGHFGIGGNAPDDRAFIVFRNESLDQADVYAYAPGGATTRIGTVLPGRADTLVVRGALTSNTLNVVARLLATSNAPQTGPFPVHPGDVYEVRLPADERTLVVLPSRP